MASADSASSVALRILVNSWWLVSSMFKPHGPADGGRIVSFLVHGIQRTDERTDMRCDSEVAGTGSKGADATVTLK